jgi:hypothetical protein
MQWLTEVYDGLNEKLFESALPPVTFELNVTRKAIFHYVNPTTLDPVESAGLEVGADMATASQAAIIDDLIHCMIHIRNHQQGVPDHTIPNQYHNRHFMSLALQVGMTLAQHPNRGWALTFSTPPNGSRKLKLVHPQPAVRLRLQRVLAKIDLPKKELSGFRAQIRTRLTGKQSKEYLLKYTCQCAAPYNTIRSGRRPDGDHPLDITCNVCRGKFKLAPRS